MTQASGDPSASRAVLLALVLLNVAMQLLSAYLLKVAPPLGPGTTLAVVALLVLVLALNVGRFIVWGGLHRRFPLSLAYPASALFFPGILAMAWWFGEPVGALQVLGTLMILCGVAILMSGGRRSA